MSVISLNLVVLKTPDMERAVAFYSQLGLEFARHRHGNGPEHYAADLDGSVLEIYPLLPEGAPTFGTRIGFRVASVDRKLAAFVDYPDAILIPAMVSEWGRRAVLSDPDGHRVELLEANVNSSLNQVD